MDPLAVWGAATGTAGAGLAVRREYLAGRRNLAVGFGTHLNVSRVEPVGEITHGWACIAFWNKGGRALAVERADFTFSRGEEAHRGSIIELRQIRAKIILDAPIELPVDSPTRKIYTPLAPMLAAGIDPFSMIRAILTTTGGKEWLSPLLPLIQSVPPNVSRGQLSKGLEELKARAEVPPRVGNEIALSSEAPFLPDPPS